MVLASFRL